MSREIGTLVIVVLKAKNLPDRHSLYKQDVFAQVTIRGKTKKTAVDARGGQHPVWDEEIRYPIFKSSVEEDRQLEVFCWRKEPRTDELIGTGKVDITDTLRTGEFDDWIQLEEKGVYRGEIYLEMTFFAAGPPPLQRRQSKFDPSERLTRPTQPYKYTNSTLPGNTNLVSPPRTPPHTAQVRPNTAPTSSTGTYLAPPASSSPHASPRASPRSRYDDLPPIPQEHSSPAAIPDILRPGNHKSDTHFSERSNPPDRPAQAPQPSPPHSPITSATPASHRSSLSGSIVPPQSLQPGPHRPRTSSRATPPPSTILPPDNPAHARYPASPPRSSPHSVAAAPGTSPSPSHPQQAPSVTSYASPPPPIHASAYTQGVPYPHTAPHTVSYSQVDPYSQIPPYSQTPSYSQTAPYIHPATNHTPPVFSQPTARPQRASYPYPPAELYPPPQSIPYAYAPPPPRSAPSPAQSERYSRPLPLPDEPEGTHTPTPARPRSYVSPAPTHQAPKVASPHAGQPAAAPPHHVGHSANRAEDPDELLARRFEEEEERRMQEARARELEDEELAKRLDLEFNLSKEGEEERSSAPQLRVDLDDTSLQTQVERSLLSSHMPGSW